MSPASFQMNVLMGLASRVWMGLLLLALQRRCPGCRDQRLIQWWTNAIVENHGFPGEAVVVATEALAQFDFRAGQSWKEMSQFGKPDVWVTVDTILGHIVPEESEAFVSLVDLAERVADVEVADRSGSWSEPVRSRGRRSRHDAPTVRD